MRFSHQLLQRFISFERAVFPTKARLFQRLARQQQPQTLFLTCADSRIVPELLTQSGPGEMFVSRNAGNLVPPHGSTADATSAAIEFAVLSLGVRSIVVCGHSDCGAMKAFQHPEAVRDMPNLSGWLRYAEPAWQAVSRDTAASPADQLRHLTEQNIALQLENLRTYPFIRERLAQHQIEIIGLHYDIGPGRLTALREETGQFVPIERLSLQEEIPLDEAPAPDPESPRANPWPSMRDFVASVIVFLVALPLCLGVALASGVPPALGLVAGIIGGLVVGSLAGAPLQVSGPAAGLVVLVAELIQDHGLLALAPALVLAGLVQYGAGTFGWGRYFRALSPAVVYGLLAGIGILIVAGQFHVLLDDRPKATGLENLLLIPAAIFGGVFPLDGSRHEMAAIAGLSTIAVMLLWNRFRPASLRMVPGALMGILAAIAVTRTFGLPIKHVDLPDQMWTTLPHLTLGSLAQLTNPALLVSALAIAVIASAETLLSATAVDRMHQGPRADFDRELRAQGVGNFLAGLAGALPITGVIVRSSANVQAGATSRWSTILHGTWLLLTALVLGPVLEYIPTSALAAVLVLSGWKLVDSEHVRRLRRYGWMPVGIYVSTVVGIVCIDLLTGVLIGVGLTVAKLLYRASQLTVMLERRAGSMQYDLTLVGSATFLRLPRLSAALDRVPRGAELHVHFPQLTYIDHSCLDLIANWEEQHQATGGRLVMEWEDLRDRFEQPRAVEAVAAV